MNGGKRLLEEKPEVEHKDEKRKLSLPKRLLHIQLKITVKVWSVSVRVIRK